MSNPIVKTVLIGSSLHSISDVRLQHSLAEYNNDPGQAGPNPEDYFIHQLDYRDTQYLSVKNGGFHLPTLNNSNFLFKFFNNHGPQLEYCKVSVSEESNFVPLQKDLNTLLAIFKEFIEEYHLETSYQVGTENVEQKFRIYIPPAQIEALKEFKVIKALCLGMIKALSQTMREMSSCSQEKTRNQLIHSLLIFRINLHNLFASQEERNPKKKNSGADYISNWEFIFPDLEIYFRGKLKDSLLPN